MDELLKIILATSQKYNVDPALLYATMMTESSGNPQATRYEPHLGESSYGLGQILGSTARGLGYTGPLEGLKNPQTNLGLTAQYIQQALQRGAHSPQDIATYYNTGHLGGTPYPGHIQRFMQNYNQYPQAQTQAANIPAPVYKPVTLPTPGTGGGLSYVVKPGDTLSGISQRLLGNASRYNSLSGYRSGNPNLIYPGEVIKYA